VRTPPLISVVMPVYNSRPYLSEAVESVLAQTHVSWELIIVDDGSTDGSDKIAQQYAADLPGKVQYVTHECRRNRGISASRNLGSRVSRGSYIACLDSDDIWLPDKLASQIQILQQYPEAGMVIGATKYWHPEDESRDRVVPVGGPQDCLVRPPALFTELYPIGSGAAPSMNTVLLRRDVLGRVGGWEETFKTAYEDQAILCKVYLCEAVYISSRACDLYRQHAGSIMSTELVGDSYYRNRYAFLVWLERWLQAQPENRQTELNRVRSAIRDCPLRPSRSRVPDITSRLLRRVRRMLFRKFANE
jgi:glycosyltransferase involved in cell wall biosynthesis